MTLNQTILKTFLLQFDEFITEVSLLFPNNKQIQTSKLYFEGLKKMNPKLMIISWQELVLKKYEKQIEEGDVSFFINKKYNDDFATTKWNEKEVSNINDKINELKETISELDDKTKETTMKYIINLTKLSKLYN